MAEAGWLGDGGTGLPYFGRIEDTAGQRRRVALLFAHPDTYSDLAPFPIIVMEVSSFPIDKKQEKEKTSKFKI